MTTTLTRTRVVTDPQAPGFRHGEEQGRRYGCPCQPCADAAYRANKLRRASYARGIRKRADEVLQQKVRSHIRALQAMHPGNTITTITAAARLPETILNQFVTGKTKRIWVTTAEAVLAVRNEDIVKEFYPRDEVLLMSGQLMALGWSRGWQSRTTGVRFDCVAISSRPTVRGSVYRAMLGLFEQVGGREARPGFDLSARSITQAKQAAKRDGYYPPAAYNDDGTVDLRSIPDHPWSRSDEWAASKIDYLRRVLHSPEAGEKVLANAHDVDEAEHDNVQQRYARLMKRLGLRMSHPWSQFNRAYMLHQLAAFDEDPSDPVKFVLDNDIADWHAREIDRTHPSLMAYLEPFEPRSLGGRALIAARRRLAEQQGEASAA